MKKNFKSNLILVSTLVMIAMVSAVTIPGCAYLQEAVTGASPDSRLKAVQTLEIAKDFRASTLEIAGNLHCDKKITDKQAIQTINAANEYRKVYLAAVPIVQAYAGGGNGEALSDAELAKLADAAKTLAKTIFEVTGADIKIPDALQ